MTSPDNLQPMQNSPQGNQPSQHSHTHAQESQSMTVCGIIGLIFGAIGFVFSFIPLINNFAFFLGAVGIILGIVGLVGTLRGKRKGKVNAILATIFSVLAIVITLVMQSAFSKAIDEASTGSSSSQSQSTATDAQSDDANANVQDQEGDLEDLHVKIVSAVKAGDSYDGKPTVMVTYEWTNNSDDNTSFMVAADAKVFQNGKQLNTAIYSDNAPEGYEANSDTTNLQPGASGTVTVGYVLDDDSPVTVEVTDLFSLNSKQKVEHTFNLS